MKKVLFFAAILLAIITSCSRDSDIGSGGETPTETAKYPVIFSVSSFKADTSPLRVKMTRDLSEDDISTFLQYIVYNEDGTEHLSKIVDINGIDIKDYVIKMELPEGDYKVAILRGKYLDPFVYGICPVNFYIDFCAGNVDFNPGGRRPNQNRELYYEWLDIKVKPFEDLVKSVVLLPIWSNLSVDVKDLATCKLPNGTTQVAMTMGNYTYGFFVESKNAKNEGYLGTQGKGSYTWPAVSEVDFKAGKAFKNIPVAQNDGTSIILSFYDAEGTLLGTVKLYQGTLTSGKNISLNGELGDLSTLPPAGGSQSFSLSLGELEDQDIPFLDKE